MQKTVRITGLIILDMVIIICSYLLAFRLRYDFVTESTAYITYFGGFSRIWFVLLAVKTAILFIFGMYKVLWRFAGAADILRVIAAVLTADFAAEIINVLYTGDMQITLALINFIIDLLLLGGIRVFYNSVGRFGLRIGKKDENNKLKRVLIVGSGYNAEAIIEKMRIHADEINRIPVAVIDDNKNRTGKILSGIKIAGIKKDIVRVSRKFEIDEIYIMIPSARKKTLENTMAEAEKTGCKIKIFPTIEELIEEKVKISTHNEISMDEIFGREKIEINNKEVQSCFRGRIILIAGAGGSIGGEIARQVAAYSPRRIILLDISEKNLFELQSEIKRKHSETDVRSIICSVTDAARINRVFAQNKPHIVIHGAAHKNVILMENNVSEAVRNNVKGTLNLIQVSETYAAEKFVYISSDKAVNPAGVAGMTVKVCERFVSMKSQDSKVQFLSVRLGNIIGSDGSVVPLFKRQIEDGGPVTLTHPDAVRFYLPLNTGVRLILQSVAMSRGGEIYTVNYGKAVKVKELAENMIENAGLKPYEDIDIKVIGLREGERLAEKLLPENQFIRLTSHKNIVSIVEEPVDREEMMREFGLLTENLDNEDESEIRAALERLASDFAVETV